METSQYLDMFIDESTEHINTLYDQLLALEENPDGKAIIEEIFRAAHTLKGMAATMGYEDLANLTHTLENIFDSIRYNRIKVQTEMMDDLLHTVDHLNAMIENIADGGDGKRDVASVIHLLDAMENGDAEENHRDKQDLEVTNDNIPQDIQIDEFQMSLLQESEEKGFHNYKMEVNLKKDCLLKAARVFMVFEILNELGEVVHTFPSVPDLEDENFDYSFTLLFVTEYDKENVAERLMKVSEVEHIDVQNFATEAYKNAKDNHQPLAATDETSPATKEKEEISMKQASSKTIRVNIERLDILMNLFEELVIDNGRLEQISHELQNNDLQETVERMTRVSSDLQDIILTMRMVPIDTVFNRFPRMIRQLARELNKDVSIEIVGAETELDRTVIDEIGDPLVHLIRNAMDHGLETPEERHTAGKSAQGHIKLEAYHSGNHVFVEITDDGAGIDVEKVKGKAITKGVITKELAEELTSQEAFELIMASGFSTNDVITDVSGRGVGLDVVKNTIESLGGTISIDSSPGKGSTFMIQLPLTLSIMTVLLIELQAEKYAIPLSSIMETAILRKEAIYHAHQQKVIDFRGNVIPLVNLKQIFQVTKEEEEEELFSVVIVRKGNKMTGLIVDSFIGQQEVVLKPLGNYLTNVFAISGATILGNGEVALIVDTNALIK